MKRQGRDAAPSGLLLLRKQAGLSSFEALGAVKQALGTGRVGHTGTLDKFAEGLLLVLTGRALKLSPWFSHCDKQYEGTIRFGIETDTLDPEGSPVAEAEAPSREAVEKALPQFTGGILQAPPAYSAIHINGRRASSLARSGEPVEMRERPVHIYRLELLSWEPPFARIFVHCSGGTYIRSLARDIARAAGSRAYLSALIRTRVAGFRLEDALSADLLTNAIDTRFRPIEEPVFSALGLPRFELGPQEVEKIIHGKPISQALGNAEMILPENRSVPAPSCGESAHCAAAVFSGGAFIAIIEKSGDGWRYGYVYARA
jgi:tRNA pseudouridine55 synthase